MAKPLSLVGIPGRPPSETLRRGLSGQKVLLAFSRGKDSVAAWLALREVEVEVVPYHMYAVPHLRFVDESIARFEDFFGCHIIQVPHVSFYRKLKNLVFQPPTRQLLIESFDIPSISYDYTGLQDQLRACYAPGAWVCTGVRAADSPQRRVAMVRHGPVSHNHRTQMVVWDWKIGHVRQIISRYDPPMPPDYEWFGRSFDGLDYRFLSQVKRHAPDDFEQLLQWFPLADLELMRRSLRA